MHPVPGVPDRILIVLPVPTVNGINAGAGIRLLHIVSRPCGGLPVYGLPGFRADLPGIG